MGFAYNEAASKSPMWPFPMAAALETQAAILQGMGLATRWIHGSGGVGLGNRLRALQCTFSKPRYVRAQTNRPNTAMRNLPHGTHLQL